MKSFLQPARGQRTVLGLFGLLLAMCIGVQGQNCKWYIEQNWHFSYQTNRSASVTFEAVDLYQVGVSPPAVTIAPNRPGLMNAATFTIRWETACGVVKSDDRVRFRVRLPNETTPSGLLELRLDSSADWQSCVAIDGYMDIQFIVKATSTGPIALEDNTKCDPPPKGAILGTFCSGKAISTYRDCSLYVNYPSDIWITVRDTATP